MKVLIIINAINIRAEVSLNYTALAVDCIDAYLYKWEYSSDRVKGQI